MHDFHPCSLSPGTMCPCPTSYPNLAAPTDLAIAFGKAASVCLDFHIKPQPKLVALICYYPTEIPSPLTKYPPHLEVCVHIAGTQGFAPAFPSYTYKNALVGFAEHDLETFDKVAASLAWTRTLRALRKSFKLDLDLEPIKEAYATQLYASRNAEVGIHFLLPRLQPSVLTH